MYSNKLAMAVKVNGRVLREDGDSVRLPFGSEYSLLIKNLNTVRALVKVEIDGNDIADGTSFVVAPNSSLDLERFLKGGNKEAGNRFKFIERTAKVEDGRGGIQLEDGLVRVTFEFEREQVPLTQPWPPAYIKSPFYGDHNNAVDALRSRGIGGGTFGSIGTANATSVSYSSGEARGWVSNSIPTNSFVAPDSFNDIIGSKSVNDAGVTAPGSVSNQKFETAYIGLLDGVKHSIVMKLLGEVGNQRIEKPVTVKSKQRCITCKHLNKANAKFCSECGTGLEIIA